MFRRVDPVRPTPPEQDGGNERGDDVDGGPAARRIRPARAWAETAVITAAVPLLGYLLHSPDPWFVKGRFSWLAFVPLFVGLRFGFAHGFGSALALVVGAGIAWLRGALAELPATYGVGLLGVGMVAGEFCDLWQRRLSRLEAINEYRRIRLDEFTRSYQLLKVSHDRLEQVHAASEFNLREAIMTMNRSILGASRGDGPLFGMEKAIVAIFANYTWVQVASLFAVDRGGRLLPEPLARLGQPLPAGGDDPLIAEALRQRKLVSVRAGSSLAERGTSLLAAIPLVDAGGRVWGLLAIQSMLFIAFHDDNLKLLAVLGAHLGDMLAGGPADDGGGPGNAAGRLFVRATRRAIDDRRRFDLPVALAGLRIPYTAEGRGAVEIITAQRRGLDQVLVRTTRDGAQAALVLLPLTGKQGFAGYLARINEQLRDRHGVDLGEAGVQVVVRQLEAEDEAEPVLALLRDKLEIDDTERFESARA